MPKHVKTSRPPEHVLRVGDVRVAIFNHEGFRSAAIECKYTTAQGGRATTQSWNAANLLVLARVAEWAARYMVTQEQAAHHEEAPYG
jgi:hypothetical protein